MKNNHYEVMESSAKDAMERNWKKHDSPPKTDQDIKSEACAFFHNFSHRYWSREPKPDESDKEELFLAEIRDMDENTALTPFADIMPEELNFSKEELQQIEEDDPGYVNEKVLDYDNVSGSENNTYRETGLHTGAIRWGDYAIKESVEYITLETGKILSRWGNEEGTFMCDAETNYDALELPIVKEKNIQSFYEVLKPFPVEISKVAKQPWNQSGESEKASETSIQYRTPIPIRELLNEGYLKKLNSNL